MELPYRFNLAEYLLDSRVAEGKGDKIAIKYENQEITFNQVQKESYKYARYLASLGITIEDRVMISQNDSPEYVYSLFGILRLGAVAVMVNPDLKSDDLQYFLDYSRAKAALVSDKSIFQPVKLEWLKHVISPKDIKGNSDPIQSVTTQDDAAIWLFSGGTTGKPKAAVQSHGTFANGCNTYAQEVVQYRGEDVTLSVPKLFFGYATGANLFFPFSVGAATVLFSERSSVETIIEKIKKYKPTVLINVPTMINRMVQYPDASKEDLSSLRVSISAGEALPSEMYNRWKEKFGVELLDGIGTAEMWHIFISNRIGDCRPGSLGKVVTGYEAKICDDNGSELADGEVGALWIKGNARAICYFNQHELSIKAFVGEWYATSDLFKRDEQGYYYYIGRKDDLMKVSGKWVSPQEIEDCLLKHPCVKECAVVSMKDADGLVKPLAFVIPKSKVTEDEIKEFIKRNIDPYKYPRKVVFVEDLPRTHLGKVDRSKLKTAQVL